MSHPTPLEPTDVLVGEIVLFLEPIIRAGLDPARAYSLLRELGWAPEALLGTAGPAFLTAVGAVATAVEYLQGFVTVPPTRRLDSFDDLLGALSKAGEAVAALGKLPKALPAGSPPDISTLPADLLDHLARKYVSRRLPMAYTLLRLLTVIRPDTYEAVVANGVELRMRREAERIDLSRLSLLIKDPVGLLRAHYLAGGLDTVTGAEDSARMLLPLLAEIAAHTGAQSLAGRDPGASDAPPAANRLFGRTLSLLWTTEPGIPTGGEPDDDRVGVAAAARLALTFQLIAGGTEPGPGLLIVPGGGAELDIGLGRWTLALGTVANLGGVLVTKSGVQVVPLPGGSAGALTVTAGLTSPPGADGEPSVLVGGRRGTRLEFGRISLAVSADLGVGEPAYGVMAEFVRGSIAVAASDGDGFLAKVLPPGGFRTDFDLAVGWSNRRGLYFRGGAALEVSLPVHTTYLGVIRLEEVDLRLTADADGTIRAGVAVTGALTLGPVTATVSRIGLRADVSFPDGGGNLGPAHLGIGFRPPDGAGLSIETPVVTGAGFLLMDEAKGLYAGIMQLEIAELVSVVAIGLITTRLPDGSPGFSLLVVLTAEFPPIQLSFGFTLNGLGGLLGVNRTMAVDVLRAGVRSRILESILFPKDPVKNANKVIADIQSAFPVAPGRFVVGLMAKVGWGTPTVVSLELGIIVELPAPIRIALIGRLTVALPEVEPIVRLRMDVLGILDFDRREASIDASLFDSVIAGFTLSGDMALRLSFGDRPVFALSTGGFHPRFVPPPEFPQLGRMTIALATSDSPRLRLEAYFAATPATFQFGARLDVYAEADAGIFGFFTATAYLSFDALVEVVPPPMRFVVDIAGTMTLRRKGKALTSIDLRLSLSGTRPWRACGEATFDFLGKRHIPIDVTIGEVAAPLGLPALDPLGDLVAALTDRRNWEAHTPPAGATGGLASVREPDLGDDVVVHPLGSVSVRQQVLPLGLDIQRYKEVDLAARHRYDITGATFGGQPVGVGDVVRAYFAAGDFFGLTEAEKLARPSFEPFVAGRTRIGFPTDATAQVPVAFGPPVGRPDDEYDTVVIDQLEPQPSWAAGYLPHTVVLDALPATAAAGLSSLRTTGTAGFAGPSLGIRLVDPEYAVAVGATLAHVGSAHPTFADAAAAATGSGVGVVGSHEVH